MRPKGSKWSDAQRASFKNTLALKKSLQESKQVIREASHPIPLSSEKTMVKSAWEIIENYINNPTDVTEPMAMSCLRFLKEYTRL